MRSIIHAADGRRIRIPLGLIESIMAEEGKYFLAGGGGGQDSGGGQWRRPDKRGNRPHRSLLSITRSRRAARPRKRINQRFLISPPPPPSTSGAARRISVGPEGRFVARRFSIRADVGGSGAIGGRVGGL